MRLLADDGPPGLFPLSIVEIAFEDGRDRVAKRELLIKPFKCHYKLMGTQTNITQKESKSWFFFFSFFFFLFLVKDWLEFNELSFLCTSIRFNGKEIMGKIVEPFRKCSGNFNIHECMNQFII